MLSSRAERDEDGRRRCPVCRRIARPCAHAVAYGSYEGGLSERVHRLKFNGVRPAAKVLGGMLAEAMTALEYALEPKPMKQLPLEPAPFEQPAILVVPVPLYKAKRRQRGFNQAELILRAALQFRPASDCRQLVPHLLLRIRNTHSQIGLTSQQRHARLRGAFAVTRAAEVTGRQVLVVDDVYTTGTTATACARVLRHAGAAKVWVATVARPLKLASNYDEFRLAGYGHPAGENEQREDVLVTTAMS